MDLLASSTYPTDDRITFIKAQLIFWLLAAIDGHGKNFSIFLTPEGYEMTPLYDVISAYPYFGQGNIQSQKIKMAMKVHGKNSHYRWHDIMLRHWYSNAKHLRFAPSFMDSILKQVNAQAMQALKLALADKNELFDIRIGEAIAEGVTKALKRLQPSS